MTSLCTNACVSESYHKRQTGKLCFYWLLQVKDNQWHTAVYDVRTNKTDILPITDVLLFDIGHQNQQFGIELGEVCFS